MMVIMSIMATMFSSRMAPAFSRSMRFLRVMALRNISRCSVSSSSGGGAGGEGAAIYRAPKVTSGKRTFRSGAGDSRTASMVPTNTS